MLAMHPSWPWMAVIGVVVQFTAAPGVRGAEASVKPATAEEAAKVLDLGRFPLLEGAEVPQQRTTAGLTYQVKAGVQAAFEFQQKELQARKWEELPGSYVTDQASSATFAHSGYKVSVSVFPTGMPEMVLVSLTNHGNIEFAQLPVPEGVKLLYGGPVSLMYVTETAAEVAELEALAKAEAERKKNAPATPATRIAVTLPDGAKDVQASKTEIEFQLASGQARQVVEGWRKQYAKDGWKEEIAEVMKEAGVVSLKKGGQGLTFIYADPGFIPAEVTVQASGAELERAVEKRNP